MYKIAISDLDGTLLGSDHRVSVKTKKVLNDGWIVAESLSSLQVDITSKQNTFNKI